MDKTTGFQIAKKTCDYTAVKTTPKTPNKSGIFGRIWLSTPRIILPNNREYSEEYVYQPQELFPPIIENIAIVISFLIFSAFTISLIPKEFLFPFGILSIILCWVFKCIILFNWNGDTNNKNTLNLMSSITFISIFIFIFVFHWLWIIPSSISLLNWLGSISIVAIFLSISLIFASTVYNWGNINKLPALTLLILFALVSSNFNWNDNHQFRQESPENIIELESVDVQFQEWLEKRPDKEEYKNKPYPVYIVSAQGGGIYAAYHTAMTLSRLQDSSSNFAQHIFAISSVSGGSLGAAVFSSIVNEYIDNNQKIKYCEESEENCFKNKTIKLLDRDFLSPLLAAGLFPDFIQRFIPFPISVWDRARSLEYALEESWNVTHNCKTQNCKNPLQQLYFETWKPKNISPALVFNTTIEETGERVLLSPFNVSNDSQNITFYNNSINFHLSTAAVLSARFPFVTPLGWFRDENGKKYRLADGGYFDNSGITTAIDIDRSLSNYLSKSNQLQLKEKFSIIPEIIHLSIVDRFEEPEKDNKDRGLNEIFSPLRTIFSTREARGRRIIQEADYKFNKDKNKYILKTGNDSETYNPYKDKFRKFLLDKETSQGNLPLGWLLSKKSQELIDFQNNGICDKKRFLKDISKGETDKDYDIKNHNSCIYESVLNELNF